MIGAIAGDMIGSPYESHPIKTVNFPTRVSDFTDDTVLTIAVANAILTGIDYGRSLKSFARKHPNLPYGASFRHWIWKAGTRPYNSYGNGAAMRVSPVGFAYETMEDVLSQARQSAEISLDQYRCEF
jgi:ADP-ribosylglycohydrolase